MITHHLERIIVVPRNGYANRLQAWASAAILGAELDVPVSVLWEPQPVATASATDLFGARVVQRSFITGVQVDAIVGVGHEELPRYLHVDRERGTVSLAGHDLGEQAFMDRLGWALADDCRPHTLLVIAGGKFHLPEAEGFTRQRAVFYSTLEWSEPINLHVSQLLADRPPYLGLHIRQTDRSSTAPPARAIRHALNGLHDGTGLESLFIAADTEQAREQWRAIATLHGLTPWTSEATAFDRAEVEAGVAALVDWIVLGRSRALVYSAASSFGEEAAVATGHADDCLALSASPALRRLRDARSEFGSIVRMPMRRLSRPTVSAPHA